VGEEHKARVARSVYGHRKLDRLESDAEVDAVDAGRRDGVEGELLAAADDRAGRREQIVGFVGALAAAAGVEDGEATRRIDRAFEVVVAGRGIAGPHQAIAAAEVGADAVARLRAGRDEGADAGLDAIGG